MAETKIATPATDAEEATANTPAAAPSSEAYAIVEASGTQMWVQANRYYDVDRLHAEVDETIKLENVLLVKDSKGTTLGQPFVKDATVALKVMAHRRGPKVIEDKMRPKMKPRRMNGHGQELDRMTPASIAV